MQIPKSSGLISRMPRRKMCSPRLLEIETTGPYMSQLSMESGRVRNRDAFLQASFTDVLPSMGCARQMPIIDLVRRVKMGVGGMTDEWTRETKK